MFTCHGCGRTIRCAALPVSLSPVHGPLAHLWPSDIDCLRITGTIWVCDRVADQKASTVIIPSFTLVLLLGKNKCVWCSSSHHKADSDGSSKCIVTPSECIFSDKPNYSAIFKCSFHPMTCTLIIFVITYAALIFSCRAIHGRNWISFWFGSLHENALLLASFSFPLGLDQPQ